MDGTIHPDAVLARAAYDGRVSAVRRALARGANPDASLRDETALWWAAQEGHAEIVSVLLDAGADANSVSRDGLTPLFQAAGGGHLAATQVLLRRGADAGRRYPHFRGGTALHVAAAYGRLRCIEALLAHGADPNAQDQDSETPHGAAVRCKEEEAAELLQRAAGELPA